MNHTYQVKLDAFEGPLDLLLHLINHYEIDIYDIPVAQITAQYMHYIHTMQHLELNIASEYLVMAATLLAIKSQMLLPKPEILDEDTEYEEDPRDELMQRLIEYRKFKEAAKTFHDKEMEAQQIFTRSPHVFENTERRAPVNQGDVSIYDMLDALGKMFKRKQWEKPLETRIQRVEIPIEKRMEEILDKVKKNKKGVLFDELFPEKTRPYIVATFVALLELMKNNQVSCRQHKHFEDLYIY
ncbi:segregation/condensation protein A [Virgibacillus halophilus]|uniref:segregation/condensation protein A n=1 Tax=Tigheibacillus halophilus TaxID=361280 RepID=UPI00362966AD